MFLAESIRNCAKVLMFVLTWYKMGGIKCYTHAWLGDGLVYLGGVVCGSLVSAGYTARSRGDINEKPILVVAGVPQERQAMKVVISVEIKRQRRVRKLKSLTK